MTEYKLHLIKEVASKNGLSVENVSGIAYKLSSNDNSCLIGLGRVSFYPSNNRANSQIADDKTAMLDLLSLYAIKTTQGKLLSHFNSNNSFDFPLVVKPNKGKQGQGVQLIESNMQLIDYFADSKDVYHRIEEPIFNKNEFRLFVQNGEPAFSFQREDGDYFTKNYSIGTNARNYSEKHDVEVRKFCKRIGKITGLDTFAIDFFADDIKNPDSYIIIEVNAEPGFKVAYEKSYTNLAYKITKQNIINALR